MIITSMMINKQKLRCSFTKRTFKKYYINFKTNFCILNTNKKKESKNKKRGDYPPHRLWKTLRVFHNLIPPHPQGPVFLMQQRNLILVFSIHPCSSSRLISNLSNPKSISNQVHLSSWIAFLLQFNSVPRQIHIHMRRLRKDNAPLTPQTFA